LRRYSNYGYIIVAVLFVVWLITEILLLKDVRKSDKDVSIWLAINVLLPFIGYILYKLSHTKVEKRPN
jgi:hypothetical protein